MNLIDDFAGGSLNEVVAIDDRVIKRYKGSLDRGPEKLREEYQWLSVIPGDLRTRYPLAFPVALGFHGGSGLEGTELHVSLIPRTSITKALLRDEITGTTAARYIGLSLRFLEEELYPLRGGSLTPRDLYSRYHAARIALARKYLRRLPYLAPLLDAGGLRVNGVECPSINEFLSWLDAHAEDVFVGGRLVAVHGNFHPDNVLIDLNEPPSAQALTFVDPRGDLVGPAHYDLAKLLITLEAYYDEIHYGGFELEARAVGRFFDFHIDIDRSHDAAYQECLKAAAEHLATFAGADGVADDTFLLAVYACEIIHILSFCFYHAYRADTDPNKIRAFLAILALLVRRLFLMWENGRVLPFPVHRLLLEEIA